MLAIDVQAVASAVSKPIRRKVELVREENTITMHNYKLDYAEKTKDVADMNRLYRAATIVTKYGRRKLAYMALRREKQMKKIGQTMRKFLKLYYPFFKAKMTRRKEIGVIKLQGVARGRRLRKVFFLPGGQQYLRWIQRTKRDLSRAVWRSWRRYKARKANRVIGIYAAAPPSSDMSKWADIVGKCKRPLRLFGVFEEYLYPGTVAGGYKNCPRKY